MGKTPCDTSESTSADDSGGLKVHGGSLPSFDLGGAVGTEDQSGVRCAGYQGSNGGMKNQIGTAGTGVQGGTEESEDCGGEEGSQDRAGGSWSEDKGEAKGPE